MTKAAALVGSNDFRTVLSCETRRFIGKQPKDGPELERIVVNFMDGVGALRFHVPKKRPDELIVVKGNGPTGTMLYMTKGFHGEWAVKTEVDGNALASLRAAGVSEFVDNYEHPI